MFAYGANTNIDSMAWRCPDSYSLGIAILPDYRFRFAGHADVVPHEGQLVEGVLWNITMEDLASLDSFEGYPSYYDRDVVRVKFRGQLVDAMVYYMTPGKSDSPPTQSYVTCLQEGYADHGLNVAQITTAMVGVVN